ncbi:hypothetical protein BY996DRAFT_8398336 [Phakopsora pachyrhizi]|nr:hypothetical protein BY996DRAFT_8398336 [Phakopsora pachyrhizi]
MRAADRPEPGRIKLQKKNHQGTSTNQRMIGLVVGLLEELLAFDLTFALILKDFHQNLRFQDRGDE